MYTSAETVRRALLRTALMDLLAAVFVAAFGAVYEMFSFGVYSYFMLYAFSAPLLLGALPYLLLALQGTPFLPARYGGKLWHAGIASLTVGALFQGVLEIYGTSSALTIVYWILGGLLLLSGVFLHIRTGARVS